MGMSIQVVYALFGGLLLLLVCFLSYLLIQKARLNAFRAKVESYKDSIKESLFIYLYRKDEEHRIEPKNKIELAGVEELLSGFSAAVQGDDIRNNITLYAEKVFTPKYKKELHHSRWSVRMNALYAIEDFGLTTLTDQLVEMYEKKNSTAAEKNQILKILVKLNRPEFVVYMTNASKPLSEFMYRSLFGTMNSEQFQQFINKFEDLQEEIQLPLIDMIGINHKLEYIDFLKMHMKSSSEELRIRSLKSLNALSFPLKVEELTKHLQSDMWQERMMATKLVGKTRDEKGLSLLEQSLKDSHFLVRSNAAQSMMKIPTGTEYLVHVYKTTDDKFSKDMAAEWLEKGGITVVE